MEGTADHFDALLRSGARRLTGYHRRLFQAEVATELCGGSARLAERRFGWGRDTVEKGLHESHQGGRCLEDFTARGRQRNNQPRPEDVVFRKAPPRGPFTWGSPRWGRADQPTQAPGGAAELSRSRRRFPGGRPGGPIGDVTSEPWVHPIGSPTEGQSPKARRIARSSSGHTATGRGFM